MYCQVLSPKFVDLGPKCAVLRTKYALLSTALIVMRPRGDNAARLPCIGKQNAVPRTKG
jgi:hypothetical protein